MPNGTVSLKVFPFPQGADNTQRNFILRGTIAIAGGGGKIYPVGGFPLVWNQVASAAGLSASGGAGYVDVQSVYGSTLIDAAGGSHIYLPTEVDVWSAANPPSGYTYIVDRTVGNLHIMVPSNGASGASGPMVEFGGTLVTSIINDVIQFVAIFPRASDV